MHLLRKSPEGTFEVVQSEYQLRGVLDAFGVAKHSGDGEYIADMGDGSYLPFRIVDGQEPQGGVDLGDIQHGSPYKQTEEGQKFNDRGANTFYNIVPDVVGNEDTGGQAFEDYVPASERG